MGGVTLVRDLLVSLWQAMGWDVPGWVAPSVVMGLVLLLLPWILRNQRTARARRVMTRAFAASSIADRDAEEALALRETWDNPDGLLVVGQMAAERGRAPVVERVVARLGELGARPAEAARLAAALAPAAPRVATLDEAVLRIERMLDNGLLTQAGAALAEARARYPEDTELLALATRLAEALTPPG